jgi:DNA polymerase-1
MTQHFTPRTALIDGDIIAYRAAAWAHGNQGDLHDVIERVEADVHDWQARAFCNKAIITLSCSRDDNYRRDHYPLYKAHRTGDPPAMLNEAKSAIRNMALTVTMKRLEADDIMGILATGTKVVNPVVITIDKDLRGVPGWHFNPDKEDFPVFVSEEAADNLFYTQWLTGDATDGFGGIKGCGPAKATKLLAAARADEVSLDWACLDAYEAKGYSVEDALAQARCARILRLSDYNLEDKVVIPWTPDNLAAWQEARAVPCGQ